MKALILNSGMGTRMGELTKNQPKCMTVIQSDETNQKNMAETIVSRQLRQLSKLGISDVVMTTGYLDKLLMDYCESLNLPLHITYVKNPNYNTTNYIYSIYCAREYLDDDILMMHGDLVFENEALERLMDRDGSCMTIASKQELSQRDFKAVLADGKVIKVGVHYFDNAVSAQPLYKLNREDWSRWLAVVKDYCEKGQTDVYAENALNELNGAIPISGVDVEGLLCTEIDCLNDLNMVKDRLKNLSEKIVYMAFSADIVHGGHLAIMKKAQRLGRLMIGVLTDEAVTEYKRYPLLQSSERKTMLQSIAGVYKVVDQNSLSYRENLLAYKPDIVVHGDDWIDGFQKPIREEVIEILNSYGGRLVEYPYTDDDRYRVIEGRMRSTLSLPDMRRRRLKKSIEMKGFITAMEAHSGITGLIVENTKVYQDGVTRQFDAMWISSLCDSTAKGKPDIELVDMTSRFRTIDDIMEVTTKPIIFDGDTGGLPEHFVYTVRTLERMGVSMVIIEDKTGLKRNSLFGAKAEQTQDTIENFCLKISAGAKAKKTEDFMICARIESLVLERGMEDALKRAVCFAGAGADAIMIHSRKKEPDEIFEFIERFRKKDGRTPLVLVPTSYNTVYEEEFKRRGANIIIYANHLTRTGFPAMQEAARTILTNHRAKECDDKCMSINEIITLIPEQEI